MTQLPAYQELARRHLPLCVTVSDPDVVRLAGAAPADSRLAYEKVVAQRLLDGAYDKGQAALPQAKAEMALAKERAAARKDQLQSVEMLESCQRWVLAEAQRTESDRDARCPGAVR